MNSFSRSQTVTIILVAFFLLLLYGWRHYSHYCRSADSPQPFPMKVVVQLTGKVRAPGNYYFDQQVTVSEAVERAGGLLHHLKTGPGWASEQVANGRRLHIMADANGVAKLVVRRMPVPSRLVLGERLNVNLASTVELAQVPGISERLAERIAEQRNRLGGFSRLEDLQAVKGIGPVSLKRLQQYLSVGSME